MGPIDTLGYSIIATHGCFSYTCPGGAPIVLRPDDLREIDEAGSTIQVQGERYPEALQKLIDR